MERHLHPEGIGDGTQKIHFIHSARREFRGMRWLSRPFSLWSRSGNETSEEGSRSGNETSEEGEVLERDLRGGE